MQIITNLFIYIIQFPLLDFYLKGFILLIKADCCDSSSSYWPLLLRWLWCVLTSSTSSLRLKASPPAPSLIRSVYSSAVRTRWVTLQAEVRQTLSNRHLDLRRDNIKCMVIRYTDIQVSWIWIKFCFLNGNLPWDGAE